MRRYNPTEIELKWQKKWEQDGTYVTDLDDHTKPKYYGLSMLPGITGAGIHIGHGRTFQFSDIKVRARRQQGYNAYNPIGWDSFGLPVENYAIKVGKKPRQAHDEALEHFKTQLKRLGYSYDWTKEISTADPKYYKWTQWIFNKLYEHDLAYQKESAQWWCETDSTVLANEQVEGGKCWRCGNPVVKKNLKQWFFRITAYADEILEATDDLNWTEMVKTMQKNWIGKSVGAEIDFMVQELPDTQIKVFTTRPDTLFGASFIVLAPEHPLVRTITTTDNKPAVEDYIKQSEAKSEIERQENDHDKTGVFTGTYAINPVNGQKVPIWVADYVLYGYGTGAIMAVPAHDERDYEFAKKHNLLITRVIQNDTPDDECSTGEGIMMNSGQYDGMSSQQFRETIVADLSQKGLATEKTQYKMRDWLISRQRYWGAPIPIIHCAKDGAVPVPDDQLPVVLPDVEDYKPTGGQTSVLAGVSDWVNTTCPKCGGPAKRETDTMDGYACSSWYFLRYIDPFNDDQAWSQDRADNWMPVDFYNGADHAVAHLLYSRFWTRFFYKLGLVPDPEPFKRMMYNAYILASDGNKMSKSKGNVIDPMEIMDSGYGADSLRVYEMFIAPYDQDAPWSTNGVPGTYRFLNRVWNITGEYIESDSAEISQQASQDILAVAHGIVKKVSGDIENDKFNTAVSSMMQAVNEFYKLKESHGMAKCEPWDYAVSSLLQILAPFAPHITEELWYELGNNTTIHKDNWPEWDEKYLLTDTLNIIVQVNGKLRANITVPAGLGEQEVADIAKSDAKVATHLDQKQIKKTVYVAGKLVNFVV